MDWTLEVVALPVTDVDRAKRFYSEQVGFAVDYDTRMGDQICNVQLTPPGSGWVPGRGGRWNSFVFFNDPDGNGWIVQERP